MTATTTAFISGIIRGTPLWVWGLFGLVLFLGYMNTRDRTIGVWRALILPLAMTATSLSFMFAASIRPEAAAAWAIALALGAWIGRSIGLASGAKPGERPMTIHVPGEWLSLVLIIGIFASRYVSAVAIAITPSLTADPLFLVARSAVTGLLGGMFLGRGLTITWLGLKDRFQGRLAAI
jgi:hypothetical protein